MWIGGHHGARINEKRVEELTSLQADTILTACPYCLVMLEDAAKSLQNDRVKCIDIAEYVRDLV
jgi:Fe-S oxidoreductase